MGTALPAPTSLLQQSTTAMASTARCAVLRCSPLLGRRRHWQPRPLPVMNDEACQTVWQTPGRTGGTAVRHAVNCPAKPIDYWSTSRALGIAPMLGSFVHGTVVLRNPWVDAAGLKGLPAKSASAQLYSRSGLGVRQLCKCCLVHMLANGNLRHIAFSCMKSAWVNPDCGTRSDKYMFVKISARSTKPAAQHPPRAACSQPLNRSPATPCRCNTPSV